MTLTFTAVYEGGVLRPSQPLPLDEGAEFHVVVNRVDSGDSELGEPFSRSYGLIGWKGNQEDLHEYLDNPDNSSWVRI